tara:strand:- start:343 stop:1425 length:1083 start_codon:yes stop_codon:yes gene_type:complete
MNWKYQVGNNNYYNKLHAIQDNLESGDPIHFVSPSEYETFDFSQEPEQSLDELLTKNAQKIRQSNKTVRLYYSGGSDSDLMLRTFVKNKIHIDEIICWKCGIPSADFEIEQYAIPRLKNLALPGTRITINETTMHDYLNFYKEGVSQRKIDLGIYNFNTHIRIIEQIEQFKEENSQEGVANIKGTTEPTVINKDGHWYTYFIDGNMEPNKFTHNFFSDDPKIQCKQAHMSLELAKRVGTDVWQNEKEWRSVTGRTIEEIKFPSKKLFFGSTDNFFKFKSNNIYYTNQKERLALEYLIDDHPHIVELWNENMLELAKLTKNQWWNNNTPALSTVGVLSKFYCLTDKSTKTVDQLYPDGFKS